MENPYETQKDYVAYGREKGYTTKEQWVDLDEMELYVEGYHLILCSVTFSTINSANVGFRLTTLPALREKTNNRIPVHFSTEPYNENFENLGTHSFHLVAYCRGAVKLQVLTSDNRGGAGYLGWIEINRMLNVNDNDVRNEIYSHKTICTMSAIPLCGAIEQKQKNVASQPIGRAAFMPVEEADDSKKPVPKNPDKKAISGGISP